MSRKKSSLNSPHHETDQTHKPESNTPVVVESRQWQQLWGKLLLNGYESHQESENGQDPTPPPPKKPVYLKLLLRLLSKFPRREKHSFDPKKVQREILEDIGKQLYYSREKQGLTLEVVSSQTRISVGLLKAIERGKLEELPEAIYTRGFIKKFADFLGLDGKSLAESFPVDLTLKSSNYSRFRFWLPVLQFRPLHLYFIYIIIVVISVQSISNTLKRAASEGTIDNIPVPVEVTPSPSQTVKKPVRIKVNTTGKVSLKVVVDGQTKFEGLLQKDTQKMWEANQNITIEASNAGLILVTFNDEKAKRLGKLGEDKKVTYQLTKVSK
ncbi:MAG: helix-turn-helix domain-containing protein [Crocosphaera sp.]